MFKAFSVFEITGNQATDEERIYFGIFQRQEVYVCLLHSQ